MNNEINIILKPCEHSIICKDCVENLMKIGNKICPICRRILESYEII